MVTAVVLTFIVCCVSCRMINVNAEDILTLSQLAKKLPKRRADRPVNPATIHRWRLHGVRGVRLECVRIGGVWCTSLQSYQRWVDQLTAAEAQPSTPSSAGPVLDDERQDRIERELKARGA